MVICESLLTPRPFIEGIAEVLFERFEVGPVYFLLSNILPLYCTGLHSGMVVDIGFCGAQITTFAQARLCMEGFSFTSSTGGLHLSNALRKQLVEDNPEMEEFFNSVHTDLIEELKCKSLFVPSSTKEKEFGGEEENQKMKNAKYSILKACLLYTSPSPRDS